MWTKHQAVLTPSYLVVEQDVASLTTQAVQTQGTMCVGYIHSLLLAEHPKLPPTADSHTHGRVPTRSVPWGRGPAPPLTGAVGGHVVVRMLAVVLDGCSVGSEVVPGGEGDKAMLQLRRRFAVSN